MLRSQAQNGEKRMGRALEFWTKQNWCMYMVWKASAKAEMLLKAKLLFKSGSNKKSFEESSKMGTSVCYNC